MDSGVNRFRKSSIVTARPLQLPQAQKTPPEVRISFNGNWQRGQMNSVAAIIQTFPNFIIYNSVDIVGVNALACAPSAYFARAHRGILDGADVARSNFSPSAFSFRDME